VRPLAPCAQIVEINGVPQPHAHQKRAKGVSFEEFFLINNEPSIPDIFSHHTSTQRFLCAATPPHAAPRRPTPA
jgi:hypothetical protein